MAPPTLDENEIRLAVPIGHGHRVDTSRTLVIENWPTKLIVLFGGGVLLMTSLSIPLYPG